MFTQYFNIVSLFAVNREILSKVFILSGFAVAIICLIFIIIQLMPITFNPLRKALGFVMGVFKIKPENFEDIYNELGFAYDNSQDIFYSEIDAWQREFGYSRLYDEAAITMGMVIDCEPIKFEYNSKQWLAELWKGQYGMTTGAEVGIYYRTDGEIYKSLKDNELIPMSVALFKNNKRIFKRSQKHWWLTGFKLGEFSKPEELSAFFQIKFFDVEMAKSFEQAAKKLGYSSENLYRRKSIVQIYMTAPKSQQPLSRTPVLEETVLKNNKNLCDAYNEIVDESMNAQQGIELIKAQKPELLKSFLTIGRVRGLYK